MIQEDYVGFETAKLLKEKGFDEKCQKVYMYNGQLLWAQIFMEGESFVDNKCIEVVANYNDWITYTQGEYAYLCPTLQMAIKWLREVHNIHIAVLCPVVDLDTDTLGVKYNMVISNLKNYCLAFNTDIEDNEYDTYEQACEAAIKYCLENLI